MARISCDEVATQPVGGWTGYDARRISRNQLWCHFTADFLINGYEGVWLGILCGSDSAEEEKD